MLTIDKLRRVFVIGAALVVSVSLTAAVSGETPRPVDVSVQGPGSNHLTKGDFHLLIDGKPVAFQLTPESRTSILILLEDSQYSRWTLSKDLDTAVLGLLDAAPQGAWFGLATYSDRLTLEDDLTQNKERIISALRNIPQPAWPEVETFDAVYRALEELALIPGRKVLVVIGSGYDHSSDRTADQIQTKIEQSDTLVYSIGVGARLRADYDPYLTYQRRMHFAQDELFLRLIAQDSGGMSWFPQNEKAFGDAARQLGSALRNQYRLVYFANAAAKNQIHRISVEAFEGSGSQRHALQVRARTSWRY